MHRHLSTISKWLKNIAKIFATPGVQHIFLDKILVHFLRLQIWWAGPFELHKLSYWLWRICWSWLGNRRMWTGLYTPSALIHKISEKPSGALLATGVTCTPGVHAFFILHRVIAQSWVLSNWILHHGGVRTLSFNSGCEFTLFTTLRPPMRVPAANSHL